VLAALAASSFLSCSSDELTGTTHGNQAPEVWLSIGPPEGSTSVYHVHFFWGGFDPDGKISHFEYAITDNDNGMFDPADTTGADKWFATEVKDSVFSFTADEIADSSKIDFDAMNPYEFVRSHTFFIRAVDEAGLHSKPAYRSFTARNLSPVVNIEIPNVIGQSIAIVPPIITFRWSARDFIGSRSEAQDPESVRSILVNTLRFSGRTDLALEYIRTTPDAEEWTRWYGYTEEGDSGHFWRPEQPLGFGSYVFAVQARDEAGAVSPVLDLDRNVRLIRVDNRITGPALTVRNSLVGEIKTSTTKTPVTAADVLGGAPISFSWSADASSYGGVVTAYRYGWDIQDLGNDDEWEVDFTPFVGSVAQSPPRTFYFGTHTFHVEVKDNSDARARVPIAINVVQFTQERPLLLIDDWAENPQTDSWLRTNGASPSDEEQDSFWAYMLDNVAGFSPTGDVLPSSGPLKALPIATLALYRTVIWNTRTTTLTNTPTLLKDHIMYGASGTNALQVFLEAGGKVLICGDHALTTVINKTLFPPNGPFQAGWGPSYPLIYRYELGGVQTRWADPGGGVTSSFAYNACCVNVVDQTHAVLFSKPRRFHCPVSDIRDFDARYDGLRAAEPLTREFGFPRLELRPEAASPGKWYAETNLGYAADIFNPDYFSFCNAAELTPRRDCFEPIYGLECLNQSSAVYGAPVAFWTSRYADVTDAAGVAARSVVFGFPPVFIKPEQMKQAIEIILFDEWKLESQSPRDGRQRTEPEAKK